MTEHTQIALLILGIGAFIGLSILRNRIARKGRQSRHHMFIQEEGRLK